MIICTLLFQINMCYRVMRVPEIKVLSSENNIENLHHRKKKRLRNSRGQICEMNCWATLLQLFYLKGLYEMDIYHLIISYISGQLGHKID